MIQHQDLGLLCRWFSFTVGFNQRTQKAKLLGALAPFGCLKKYKNAAKAGFPISFDPSAKADGKNKG